MTAAAGSLKELHQLHLQLAALQEQLARGPKQVEARKRKTAAVEGDLQEKQDQLKQLKMAADGKSLQLKTNEQKISELKTKLNTAASNREFAIIRSQIEADTMANSVLEDEILDALEKVDQMQRAIGEAQAELKRCREAEEQVNSDVTAARPELQEQAAAIQSDLKTAEDVVPATIRDQYRRLVQAHGSGALAPVQNRACGACHSLLSPQHCVEVNTGKPTFCRGCGRLLYQGDE